MLAFDIFSQFLVPFCKKKCVSEQKNISENLMSSLEGIQGIPKAFPAPLRDITFLLNFLQHKIYEENEWQMAALEELIIVRMRQVA